ncbi:MAG: creatininase family protein [Lentisphaerae bacterium]|nr:creatininase family protein [Lentisphaerota bacterium]
MALTNKVRWEEMLPHEFLEARDRFPACYMAYGLAEPHGAYNALGLDWLKAYALVESAAQRQGGIVAPPFAWHIQELPGFHDDGKGHGWLCDAGVRQPLCSSIPSDLFYRIVLYQIRAMDARGFHAAVLVTGHYGGVERVLRKLCEYYLRRTGSPIRFYAIADWECIDERLPYRGDHAGVCETSQLMALRPGLTDLNRKTAAAELGERYAGYVNFSKGPLPTEETGRTIVESQVRNLCDTAARLLAEYRVKDGWIAPDLDATEKIWNDFERMARKYWDITYDEYRNGKQYFQLPAWEELERRL